MKQSRNNGNEFQSAEANSIVGPSRPIDAAGDESSLLPNTKAPEPNSSSTNPTTTAALASASAPSPSVQTHDLLIAANAELLKLEITYGFFSNLYISLPPAAYAPVRARGSILYHVWNSSWRLGKPSVLISEKSKHGKPVASMILRWGRADLFSVGSTESEMRWESLHRTSVWTHSRFEFEWDFGKEAGGRRRFVWRRLLKDPWTDQPDLELRELFESGVPGMRGWMGKEVLALYSGMHWHRWRRRGGFVIRRVFAKLPDSRPLKLEDMGDWEVVILVTALGIVEAARRRANNRRQAVMPPPSLIEKLI
ncbi:hypothetical protein M430DRAFT_32752 [Amorphotheca resinae ATCC 22711]|jgi:hypothetical protein|uniref:Uncharacterized protein n=1 Tax=Amorphotheca resinae ATCC 22711 TaxID=857342 RepID=A0A2T3BFZ5_AMORE|nr:hypothetical protein M430DRAFT_32752 [Amorphotheca resinae ATCC 22711]PSS28336.1 hypothetical protein M430DRAFT_32752 [Amorphotheca resinae ATCC 22711]